MNENNSKLLVKASNLLIVVMLVFNSSCQEDNFDIFDQGKVLANISPTKNISYLFGISNGINIEFNKSEGNGISIVSVDVSKQLLTHQGNSDVVTYTIQNADRFLQSKIELFEDVPIFGIVLTSNDLLPWDKWVFNYTIKISGGRVLTPVSSTTINFLCQSNIPTSGTWDGVGLEFINRFSTNKGVKISTLNDNGFYKMSDITAGFYLAFGFDKNQPGIISELCSVVKIVDSSEAQFNIITATPNNSNWDPVTQILVLDWYDAGNAFGETSTFTYVP